MHSRKKHRLAGCIMLLLLFLLSISSVAGGTEKKLLKLGVIPFKSPRTVVELYTPVASYLSTILGEDVQVVTAKGYEQYMQRIYAGQYDIIVLGSTFYFKAHDTANYQAIARGYPPFHAGIVVLVSSGIDNLEQLRGKSLAAVNSTDRGGYKLQKKALSQRGIQCGQDLTIHFRGDFDSVVYSVLSGQDAAGAVRLDALQKPAFARLKNKIKILYSSPENPQFPFAIHPDMDSVRREKIKAALLSITMERPETAAILQKLHVQGIEAVNSSDLERLRKARQEEAKRMAVQ